MLWRPPVLSDGRGWLVQHPLPPFVVGPFTFVFGPGDSSALKRTTGPCTGHRTPLWPRGPCAVWREMGIHSMGGLWSVFGEGRGPGTRRFRGLSFCRNPGAPRALTKLLVPRRDGDVAVETIITSHNVSVPLMAVTLRRDCGILVKKHFPSAIWGFGPNAPYPSAVSAKRNHNQALQRTPLGH